MILKLMNDPHAYGLRDKSILNAMADCGSHSGGKSSGHTEAFVKRGDILQRLRRYDDAINSYDRALKIQTGDKENILTGVEMLS